MGENNFKSILNRNLEKFGSVDNYKKEMFDDTMYYQKKLKFERNPNPKYATWNNERILARV